MIYFNWVSPVVKMNREYLFWLMREENKGRRQIMDYLIDRLNMDNNDVPEPERREDELTEIAEVLGRTLNQGLVVDILHYRSKRYHQIKGKVVRWDQPNQSIIMDQGTAIPVRFIVKVELEELE
jgi:hypothetical protein